MKYLFQLLICGLVSYGAVGGCTGSERVSAGSETSIAARAQSLSGLRKIRIVICGDSTVENTPRGWTHVGWGQELKRYFSDDVEWTNLAAGGRSSKSFIKEGRLAKALALKPEYLLIQFGHNDGPGKGDRSTDPDTDYKDYIRQYVDGARYSGVIPILITPPAIRSFQRGRIRQGRLKRYADAMKQVASEKDVPVIDLYSLSIALFERLGPKGCAPLAHKKGKDRIHFSLAGAREMAKLISVEIPHAVPTLKQYLKHPSL